MLSLIINFFKRLFGFHVKSEKVVILEKTIEKQEKKLEEIKNEKSTIESDIDFINKL